MFKAKDIMNSDIVAIDPEETVEHVMEQMIGRGISGLPVIDMSGQLVGVITEFDLLELVWDPNTDKNKVYHYMTRDVRTVDENCGLVEVADTFQSLSVRRLLVVRGDAVVGIISRRDLIRCVLKIRGQMAARERPVTA